MEAFASLLLQEGVIDEPIIRNEYKRRLNIIGRCLAGVPYVHVLLYLR